MTTEASSTEQGAMTSIVSTIDQSLPREEENAASMETHSAGTGVHVCQTPIAPEGDLQNATNAAKLSGYADQNESGPSTEYVIRTSRATGDHSKPDSESPAPCKILLVDDSAWIATPKLLCDNH